MSEPVHRPEISGGDGPLTPFLVAAQFLTVMPPVLQRPFTPLELGRAVGFYPLVGLLLGSLLAGANLLLGLIFPPGVRAALLLALWVLFTGALHLDGFLDACDGIFGGWTPQKRLEIMRDERVGAFALAGGVLLLLLKFAVLAESSRLGAALILAPVLGRWGMSLALIRYPYARAAGLGREIKDYATGRELLLATGTAVLVTLFIFPLAGILALASVLLTTVVVARFVLRRIPGLTGDIYGTICELGEMVTLLTWIILA